MERRWRFGVVVLCVLSITAAACGGGGSSSSSSSTKGGGSTGTDQPDDTSGVKVSEPIQVAYRHVKDSSGANPDDGSSSRLLFEPGGAALLYRASTEAGAGWHGTWKYQGGKMTLRFDTSDVSVDGVFDLDLDKSEVTLPFQLFGTDPKGTSTWKREVLGVMQGTLLVFNTARYDSAAAIPRDEAVKRATAYADARAALDGGVPGSGKRKGTSAPAPRRSDGMQPISFSQVSKGAPTIVDTKHYDNGVTLVYDDGTSVDVVLFSWKSDAAGQGDAVALRQAQLASDPRVHLPTMAPGNGAADPHNKTAVLINPFETEFGEKPAIAEATSELKGVGYQVTTVGNGATFEEIARGLVGKPGFVTFSTHGNAGGAMATGEILGKPGSPAAEKALFAKMKTVAERIETAFPGSRTFQIAGQPAQPYRLMVFSTGPGTEKVFVGLSPSFWSWITQNEKASFSDSLVFLSACEVDQAADVRKAVAAKAFFGFDEQASISGARDVFRYLVKQLVRPTRSAEEAYYNLVRVVNTGQMIYEDDTVLDGSQVRSMPKILNAYGPSRAGTQVEYSGNGWLGSTVNQGQVWWMTFSGRWSQDAAQGATKLMNCWDLFWSKGTKGGLASPGCNASNDGDLPTVDEVSYAVYLLTGGDVLSFSGTKLTRWTLADARTS